MTKLEAFHKFLQDFLDALKKGLKNNGSIYSISFRRSSDTDA